MHNVVITALVGLTIVLFVATISFFVHIDHSHADTVKVECIKAGKDWVVNEKSDSRHPIYECVTSGN